MKHAIYVTTCLLALLTTGCEHVDPHAPESTGAEQATNETGSQTGEIQSPDSADSIKDPAEADTSSQPLTTKASWNEVKAIVMQSKGKVVVVDIWSTYCAPCLQEFPHLLALQKEHPEEVVCISFNINFAGLPNQTADTDLPLIHQFLERQTSQVTNFVSTQTDEEIYAQLKIIAIPAIIVFNPQGERVATVMEKSGYQTKVFPLVNQLLE